MDSANIGQLAEVLDKLWHRAREARLDSRAPTSQEAREPGLVDAHGLGRRGLAVPESEAEAYAVQDALITRLGPVGGWKVGKGSFGHPNCAPVFESVIHGQSTPAPLPPVYSTFEAEIAFVFQTALPPRAASYEIGEIAGAIGETCVSLEFITPRIASGQDDRSTLLALADGLSCGALMLGEGVPGYVDPDAKPRAVKAWADGALAFDNPECAPGSRIPDLLVWLANHLSARGLGIAAGQCVTTGSWIGALPLSGVTHISAAFDRVGSAQARLAPALPYSS